MRPDLKRLLLSLVPVLLLHVVASAPAQEGQARAPAGSGRAAAWHVETTVHASQSPFGLYVATEPHVMWRPGLLGAGLGARLAVGASQFDIAAAPFVRLEAGWFYLNGGWNAELLSLTSRFRMLDDGLSLAAGLAPAFVRLGYGRLGVDVGVDVVVDVLNQRAPPPVEAVIGTWRIEPWLRETLAVVLETSLLRVGLLYTFSL